MFFIYISLITSAFPARAEVPVSAFAQTASRPRVYETVPSPSLGETRPLGRPIVLPYLEGRSFKDHNAYTGGVALNFRGHERFNVLAAVASHQLSSVDSSTSPLVNGEPLNRRHRFVRMSAGLQFPLPYHFSLETWAGTDIAGGRSNTIEASLSWWPLAYTYRPIRLEVGLSQDDRTHIRVHTAAGEMALGRLWGLNWYLTGTGRLYADGPLRKNEGWGAGGIAAGDPKRGWGFKLEGGGGAHGLHGDLSLFHNFRL